VVPASAPGSESAAPPPQQLIKREGSRSSQYQRGQARKIEQVRLVSWLSEMSSGGGHRLKFDGAEAIGQMYGENGDKQHNCHWDAGERDKRSDEHCEATQQLDENCRPGQHRSRGHSESVQNIGKIIRSSCQFRVAVLHEAVADDQAKRDREPSLSQRGEKMGGTV